jgi:hypothetical protein
MNSFAKTTKSTLQNLRVRLLCSLTAFAGALALDNGLARSPPLGFSE